MRNPSHSCSYFVPSVKSDLIFAISFSDILTSYQSDSEYMAGQLSAFGYAISENPDEGDLWLINT